MDDFKNVGTYPVELASGAIVPVGEFATLSADEVKDPHNQAHIEEGRLMKASVAEDAEPVEEPQETTPAPRPGEKNKEKEGGK